MKMNWFYKSREERSRWLTERFGSQISKSESLLDVGCYNQYLKEFVSDKIKYTGIDIAGKPDIFINLDEIEKLPFNNNQFDTVICADVLEHLENIHLVFDELCRISAKYVIITLPNSYSIIPEFLKGKKYTKKQDKLKQFGKYSKFYGLPLEKPEDRHRWFFAFDEAHDFIEYRSKKSNFTIDIIESEYKYEKKSFFAGMFFSILRKINKNLVYKNIIVLLKFNS